jgi:hypothetical protein
MIYIMKESIQIFLNSKTANSYIDGFTSNCKFNLPVIVLPKGKKIFMSVQSATIPYSFYNIDYFNNQFVYNVNGGSDILVEIPQGNYNTTTLRNYLSSVMTGFTIVYSSLDNTFTFTHPTAEFEFKDNSTCMECLGFDENLPHSSTTRILKSTNSINLFTIRNIYIQSTNLMLNNINNSTPNLGSILASIPLTTGANSVINYNNFNNVRSSVTYSDMRNLGILNVNLTDQDGDTIDLNGCHFSLTLQIDYE